MWMDHVMLVESILQFDDKVRVTVMWWDSNTWLKCKCEVRE